MCQIWTKMKRLYMIPLWSPSISKAMGLHRELGKGRNTTRTAWRKGEKTTALGTKARGLRVGARGVRGNHPSGTDPAHAAEPIVRADLHRHRSVHAELPFLLFITLVFLGPLEQKSAALHVDFGSQLFFSAARSDDLICR